MSFHGNTPNPGRVVCSQCNHSYLVCREGDVFFTRTCPHCKSTMDIKSLDNPLLSTLIKNIPSPLRRRLFDAM